MRFRSKAVALGPGPTLAVFSYSLGTALADVEPQVYFAPGRMLWEDLGDWTDSPYPGSANFSVGLSSVVAVPAPGEALELSPGTLYEVFHVVLWGWQRSG